MMELLDFVISPSPRWIGRNGSFLRPPRSPGLTPGDFYLWGHMEVIVCLKRANTRDELGVCFEQFRQQYDTCFGMLGILGVTGMIYAFVLTEIILATSVNTL